MAIVGSGASHRQGLKWAVDAARIAIALAIISQIVISTIPARLIYATADGSFDFESWAYVTVSALSTLASIAAVVALTVLPLVAVWVLVAPSRLFRTLAIALTLIMALVIVQSVVFLIPSLATWADLQWYRAATGPAIASILLVFPFMVQTWIGVLVLIAVLCGRAERPALTIISTVLCLIILGLTLAQATSEAAPEGKALVVVFFGVWLWLTGAKTGVIPPGAHPWLIALLAVWIVPEVVSILPHLIDAMQIISVSARWGTIAQAFANLPAFVTLSSPLLTLMILLAVLHMAFETAKPTVLDLTLAVLIALGLILPEIAWQWGYPTDLVRIIEMGRSGAMQTDTAILAGIAALSWRLAQVALFVAVIRLIRLPLSQIAPK